MERGVITGTRLPTDPEKGRGGVSKPIKVKCIPKAKGPTGVPTGMSLGKASKPATLDERLVAGALRLSVVTKVVACYEPWKRLKCLTMSMTWRHTRRQWRV